MQSNNNQFHHTKPLHQKKPTFQTYKHHHRYSVASIPHVGKPFTQGLTVRITNCTSPGEDLDKCLDKNQARCYQDVLHRCGVILYESGGLYGRSKIRKITNFDTGKPDYSMPLPKYIFAEGLQTVPSSNSLILASWREQLLFLINDTGSSLKPIQTSRTPSLPEHWGVAVAANQLLMTSGDDNLYTVDLPLWIEQEQFNIVNVTRLRCGNDPVHHLNELDYDAHRNSIWGNIWLKDILMEFDYQTGQCKGILDLSFLNKMESRRHPDAVWNGVACLGNDWMILTGKFFSKIYILKLLPTISGEDPSKPILETL